MKIFKMNNKNENTTISDSLFDFTIIGFVAIIFANVGKALVNNNIENLLFGIGNVILVSTTWFSYIFYSTRIQKRVWKSLIVIWIIIFTLVLFALGVKEMFISDSRNSKLLVTWTYIISRLLFSLVYFIIIYTNKSNSLYKIILYKAIFRIIGIIFITLSYNNFNTFNFKSSFIILGILELIGNSINVKDKILVKLPILDYEYNKQRIVKLNSLYVGSFLITSGNVFSKYFEKIPFLELIGFLTLYLFIGMIIWTVYTLRISQFSIKNNARNLLIFSTTGVLMDISTTFIGSAFLEVDKVLNVNINIILTALLIFILTLFNFLFIANWDNNRKSILFKYKFKEYIVYIICISITIINSNYLSTLFGYIFVILVLISIFINSLIQETIANKKTIIE